MTRVHVGPLHVNAVTGFVTNTAGRVLLVRVASRGWEMPGGQVEEGEDLFVALCREVEEESGCSVEVRDLIGVYSRLTSPAMVVHLFRCEHASGEASPREADIPEVGWFDPGEAIRLVRRSPSAERLADALAGRSASSTGPIASSPTRS